MVLFNSFVDNTTTNVSEVVGGGAATSTGPNTILGNFAFHSSGDASNYVVANSTINKVILSQSGAFPTTIPTYWHNISMTP